jgi:hypothetical protein
MSNYKFKTTNIKGKDYVEVNQRVLFFRKESKYEGWTIENELVAIDSETCIVKSTIRDTNMRVIASAHAQEDRTSSMINKTSYVENCETSAVGRALAMLGIGIETSIASSNEVAMAIAKQDMPASETKSVSIPNNDVFQSAIDFMKKNGTPAGLEKILAKYGEQFSEGQKTALSKFVKK